MERPDKHTYSLFYSLQFLSAYLLMISCVFANSVNRELDCNSGNV